MIRSMTGFGRGETESGGHRFRVEARSVNHRYLDAAVRLPFEWSPLDSALTS